MLPSVPLLPPLVGWGFLSGIVARSKPSGLSLSLKIFHWKPQLFYQSSHNLWSFNVWSGSKQVVSVVPCWKGTKGFLHPEICLLSLCSPWLQSSPVPMLSCFSLQIKISFKYQTPNYSYIMTNQWNTYIWIWHQDIKRILHLPPPPPSYLISSKTLRILKLTFLIPLLLIFSLENFLKFPLVEDLNFLKSNWNWKTVLYRIYKYKKDILRAKNDILKVREWYFIDENSEAEERRPYCPYRAYSV